jgi:hypothetical protein
MNKHISSNKTTKSNWVLNSLKAITIIIIANICFNTYIFYNRKAELLERKIIYLQFYSEAIKSILVQDLKTIVSSEELIQNLSVFNNLEIRKCTSVIPAIEATYNTLTIGRSNNCIRMNLSLLREFLRNLSDKLFLFSIKINNKMIITNNLDGKIKEYISSEIFSDQHDLSVELTTLDNSTFMLFENNKLILQTCYSIIISLLVIICFAFIVIMFFREKDKKQDALLSKEKLLQFIKVENDFIISSYQYSLQHRNIAKGEDYFPLPIVENIDKVASKVRISTEDVERILKNFFDLYKNHYNENQYHVNTNFPKNTFFEIPFDQEVMEQLLISMIYNIFIFNKNNLKEKSIIVSMENDMLNICSTGLKLTAAIAVKASERVFFDSVNPFILKFNQIFGILDMYQIKHSVEYSDEGTKISMKLTSFEDSKKIHDGKVVNIIEYKKEIM